MIKKIKNSIHAKTLAVICVISTLCLSFKGKEVIVLKAGTTVPMETVSTISSELLTVGRTIDFRITDDIVSSGEVLIPEGSIAQGQVVRVQPAKGLGQGGYVAVEMRSVKAIDGTRVSLAGGDIYQEGQDQQALALVLGLVVCILFLTIKGKNAIIPAGYVINPSVAVSADIEL